MNRRKFLAFFGLATSVPVVAKLPDTLPAVEGVPVSVEPAPGENFGYDEDRGYYFLRSTYQIDDRHDFQCIARVYDCDELRNPLKALREQNHRTFLARKTTYWM